MRMGLLALGIASLFGLGAWSSRGSEQRAGTLAGDAAASLQADGAGATTLEPILIEVKVPSTVLNSSASQRRATAPTAVANKPTNAPGAARSNALGYDFGL